jgi:hypothetical protein
MSFDKYVEFSQEIALDPQRGHIDDTDTHFIAILDNARVRVPRKKYQVVQHRKKHLNNELQKLRSIVAGLRHTYIVSRNPNDLLRTEIKNNYDKMHQVIAEINELKNEKRVFLSLENEVVTPKHVRVDPDFVKSDEKKLNDLRKAHSKGNTKKFLFDTYNECMSSASKKSYYMSRADLMKAVKMHYPKAGVTSKTTKKELCDIVFS